MILSNMFDLLQVGICISLSFDGEAHQNEDLMMADFHQNSKFTSEFLNFEAN